MSHFRIYFFFASKRNEAKQKPFRFLFASFCETKTIIFRFVSLQFFRFVSLHFFNFCYNYYLQENGERREEWGCFLLHVFSFRQPKPTNTPRTPTKTHQHQPTPANTSQHQPTPANTHQHPPTPTNTHQHPPTPAKTHTALIQHSYNTHTTPTQH